MAKEQEADFLASYEEDIRQAQANQQQAVPYSAAMYAQQQKQNLVEWQLDFKPEIEGITRVLRNDILYTDKDGREFWIQNPDKTKIPLNDLGVNDIIKKVLLLINKNKVLSNYTEEQIQKRLKYICHAIRELIYLNYEYYDMDNDYKWNCYYSIVVDLDDMIEAAYRRALNGEERRDLNSARMVTQNDPVMPQMNMYNQQPQQKKRHVWNPFTWGR